MTMARGTNPLPRCPIDPPWPLARGRGRVRPRPSPSEGQDVKKSGTQETGQKRTPLREERVLFMVDRVWWSMRTPVGSRRGVLSEGDGADAASDVDALGRLSLRAIRAGFSKEILRKEVIQPQVPLRLPCYDLVPITGFIFGACLAAPATSDAPRFGGLTGGVYKAQEHIHRGMLIRDY